MGRPIEGLLDASELKALSVFISILYSLFILDDMKSSSTTFQATSFGSREKQCCKTTSFHYLPKRHIAIYNHVVQFSKNVCVRSPNGFHSCLGIKDGFI